MTNKHLTKTMDNAFEVLTAQFSFLILVLANSRPLVKSPLVLQQSATGKSDGYYMLPLRNTKPDFYMLELTFA